MRIKLVILLLSLQVITSCTSGGAKSSSQEIEQSKQLGQKKTNLYADHFEIHEFSDYSLLTILGKGNSKHQYALYKEGAQLKNIPAKAIRLQVPLKNIASLSCVYTRAFYELGGLDYIKGIDAVKHHYLDEVRNRYEKGDLQELSNNNQLNIERVLNLEPDGLFTYNIDEQDNHFDKVAKANIPVIFCTEYLENHPLGKAEWIKVFAKFIGKEVEADSIFSSIARDYKSLTASLKIEAKKKKTVFCNAPFMDAWYLPNADSFTAQFFKDAGLDYIWKDAKGEGNQSLSIEVILDKALEADLWLNSGSYTSYSALEGLDTRLSNFKAFKQKRIYNTFKRTRSHYGNDFWEMGSLHPDLILKDIVSIAYPEMLPHHEKVFYKALD